MNSSKATATASLTRGLLSLAAAAALVACSSPVKLNTPAPVETRSGATPGKAGTGAAGGSTAGAGGAGTGATGAQGGVASVDLTKNDGSMALGASGRVVYFDYDSYVVKDEFRPVVEGNAKALAADRKVRASIEGHTDERGGREYNLALGQKRSEAVVKALTLLGANEAQLEAVSFGKERPAAQGSDEAAFAKNRRVEIVAR